LGLTLDESENAKDTLVKENEIDVLLDDEIRKFLERGRPLKIDFQTSKYGSGFFIDTGYSC